MYEAMKDSVALADDVETRIYERSSLGVGDIPASPEPPYLLYGEEANIVVREVQDTARCQHRSFRFAAYDERGNYLRIERILRTVRETMLALSGQVSPTGVSCLGVWWSSTSDDGVDIEQGLNTKFIIVRFTTNG